MHTHTYALFLGLPDPRFPLLFSFLLIMLLLLLLLKLLFRLPSLVATTTVSVSTICHLDSI
jgi:hypothetical protein